MTITAEQKEIITATVPFLKENGLLLTNHFYERMFKYNPELKNVFNMSNQSHDGKQRAALAFAVLAYASNINSLENLGEMVKTMASKHVSLGIRAEHYGIVGNHLIASIQELLGDKSNDDIINAWKAAYDQLAKLLIEVESNMYTNQIADKQNWTGWRPFIIKKKHAESIEVMSLYLYPADGGKLGTFEPGQYISIQVFIPDLNIYQARQYSISCRPNSEFYRISVKKEAYNDNKGLISHKIHDELDVDHVVHISAPTGLLTLKSTTDPIVFISGGIGITPFISQLDFLAEQNPNANVYWLHGCRTRDHHSFADFILNIEKIMPNFKKKIFYNSTTSEDLNNGITEGNLELSVISDLPLQNNTQYYICGPAPFISKQLKDLATIGVERSQIFFEEFGPSSMSFFSLIVNSDIVIKLVLLTMFMLSILIWAILFEKLYRFNEVNRRSDIFEKKFWSGIMLEEFYEKNKSKLKHPMGQIFSSAMQEWIASETNKSVAAIELIKPGIRERINVSIDTTVSKIEISINKYMSFLNVIASISPFVGLFGTVWGIMSSFRSIADSGNVSLTAVAPGVSEALITTAIGILIAICATVLHSYLKYKVHNLLDRLYAFGAEISNILSREMDAFSVKNYNTYNNIES